MVILVTANLEILSPGKVFELFRHGLHEGEGEGEGFGNSIHKSFHPCLLRYYYAMVRVRVRVKVAQAALTARSHHRIAIQAVQNKI